MLKTTVLATLFLTLLAGSQPAVACDCGEKTQIDDVEQFMKAFLVPFSSQNVAEFIEYFADDATVFFPSARFGSMRVEGKASIAKSFGAVFKQMGLEPAANRPLIQPQDLKVERFDGFAIVTFHLGSDQMRGRRTFVLRRVGATWKIVHLHASTMG